MKLLFVGHPVYHNPSMHMCLSPRTFNYSNRSMNINVSEQHVKARLAFTPRAAAFMFHNFIRIISNSDAFQLFNMRPTRTKGECQRPSFIGFEP
jgi:hypothetical protein